MIAELDAVRLANRPLAAARALTSVPLRAPGAILAGLRDVGALVRAGAILEEAVDRLATIEARVETLNEEVALMRRGVDSIGTGVEGVRDSVRPLEDKLEGVAESVEPLRRFRRRRSR
jgi:hypothetical protein